MIRKIISRPGLALLLAFLVVGLLFVVTALLDLRRTEATLLGIERARAETLVEALEVSAGDLLDRTLAGEDATIESSLGRDTTVYDVMAADLLAVGRRIAEADPTSRREIADAADIAGVAAVGLNGRIETGPALPPSVRGQLQPLLEGRAEVALDLFGAGQRFVAFADPGRRRVLVLLLDAEGFRRRALRVALQAATEAATSHRDVAYILVEDGSHRVLARAGQVPSSSRVSTSLTDQSGGWIDLKVPLRLKGLSGGSVRIGLGAEEARSILSRHRMRIAVSSALLMAIGFFAVGLLYWVQRRHHRDLVELQAQLYRAERLSSLGRLGAGLAHEIRNPLNGLGLGLQRIQREFLPPEGEGREAFRRITGVMRDEARRLNALVEEFLSASPDTRIPASPLSAAEVVQETVLLLEAEAASRNIQIESRLTPVPCPIVGDRDKLRQALLNLLRNALEAIPSEGRVQVAVDAPHSDRVRIRIRDSGVGIPAGLRERIFDPDFTTKEKGLGLGLAIAHEIVRAHGGELEIASQVGEGTTVDLWLPLAR